MAYKRLICSCCGGDLTVTSDTQYFCKYCGAKYEKDVAEEMQEMLANALKAEKIERLSNARRALHDASHAKYPSEAAVVQAANNVLSINPDDPIALVYLHSHDESAYDLARILPTIDVEENTANEIYTWMMRKLSNRQIGPLDEFVQRHFKGKELTKKLTALEEEAEKINQGYYLSTFPRDVFVAYSSNDMPKVMEVIHTLEDNGFSCFAAFRNLRHGRGAKENYLKEIEQAIKACKTFVFVSSIQSRTPYCDAVTVELPYLTQLEGKPRVEYMLDEDDGRSPILVKRVLKEAFPTQERVHDEETLVLRIDELIKSLKAPKKKKPEVDLEEFEKKQKALEAKQKAIEEKEAKLAKEKEEQEKAKKAEEDKRLKELEEKLKALEAKSNEPRPAPVVQTTHVEATSTSKKEAPKAPIQKPVETPPQPVKQEELSEEFLKLGKFTPDGDYIKYGVYPQDAVKDSSLVDKLRELIPDKYGDVVFEGKKYRKLYANYYSYQPILWRVVDNYKDTLTLMSVSMLDVFNYKELKTKLNGEFKENALFSGEVERKPYYFASSEEVGILSWYKCKELGIYDRDNEMIIPGVPSEYVQEKAFSHKVAYEFGQDYIADSNGNVERKNSSDLQSTYARCVRPFIRVELTNKKLKQKINIKPPILFDPDAHKLSKEFLKLAELKAIDNNTISFGVYPQDEIKDAKLIKILGSETPDSNGIIIYEGKKYAFFKDKYYSFSPIIWKVAEERNDSTGITTYFLTERAIDARQFDSKDVYYGESNIKEFLSKSFVRIALLDFRKISSKPGLFGYPIYNSVVDINNLNKVYPTSYSFEKYKDYLLSVIKNFNITEKDEITIFCQNGITIPAMDGHGISPKNPKDFDKASVKGIRPFVQLYFERNKK